MKTYFRIFSIILLLSVTSMQLACAGRLPSTKTAQHSLERYFKKYGRKYKETDFGQHKVQEVEVNEMQELQHGLVLVTAFVSLDQGTLYKVNATMEKKTLLWKVVSWENRGKAE